MGPPTAPVQPDTTDDDNDDDNNDNTGHGPDEDDDGGSSSEATDQEIATFLHSTAAGAPASVSVRPFKRVRFCASTVPDADSGAGSAISGGVTSFFIGDDCSHKLVQTDASMQNMAVFPTAPLSSLCLEQLALRPHLRRCVRRDPQPPCVRSLQSQHERGSTASLVPESPHLTGESGLEPLPCTPRRASLRPAFTLTSRLHAPQDPSPSELVHAIRDCAARKISQAFSRFVARHFDLL